MEKLADEFGVNVALSGSLNAVLDALQSPDGLLIDVRTAEEFAAGALPGAQRIGHEEIAAQIASLAPDLDTPIASADPVVASYIRQQVQSRQQATLTVSDEVRQMVLVLLPRGRNTVDQVARLMGITRRTLHRHLAAEGQVFSELVLSVRRELVSRYLQQPSRSLGEIAQLLGFADLSSFSRWHRQQFGAAASRRGGPR